MQLSSFGEILRFAIRNEQAAERSYRLLADQALVPATRKLMRDLADEEAEHQRRLRALPMGTTLPKPPARSQDQGLYQQLVDVRLAPTATLAEILIAAIKKEERATQLYRNLAQQASDAKLRQLFTQLAEQERGHRQHLEELFLTEVLDEI